MKKIHRRLISYCFATVLTYLLASTFHTLLVLGALTDVGVNLPSDVWLRSVISDWGNLLAGFAPIVAAALLLAFVVVSALRFQVSSYGKRVSYWIFPFAGALSMLIAHLLISAIFDIYLIAGARGVVGLSTQVFAGWCGGLVYASTIKYLRLQRQKRRLSRRRNHYDSNKQAAIR
ncbi:hypothetical protein [Neptunicella marina]|uniref:Uncharacterized protein n=1 Tax=Neptunicella marina TaxID=2125989 RepID=A0A8J6LX51_9ALTE|nr:hypothetical protein [Neptunicella marina]MBC3764585.1 hypothetical protein [Neptunicella marina]